MHRVVDLARAVVEVDAERQLDDAVIARDDAIEPRGVALVDLAAGERALEGGVGGRILGDDQEPRGVEVEASASGLRPSR